ncbi:MAG: hypothetical protein ACT4TC_04475 [Myxococcaceae bacterium]
MPRGPQRSDDEEVTERVHPSDRTQPGRKRRRKNEDSSAETEPTLTSITRTKKPKAHAQLIVAMKWAVQNLEVQKQPREKLRAAFKLEWLPLLKQALKVAGGDALDSYLRELLTIRGPAGRNTMLREIIDLMKRFNHAADRPQMIRGAKKLVTSVRRYLEHTTTLSMEVFESELGDVSLETLLEFALFTDDELSRRRAETGHLIDELRVQLKSAPGQGGLHRTFNKLQRERGLLDAEARRRASYDG